MPTHEEMRRDVELAEHGPGDPPPDGSPILREWNDRLRECIHARDRMLGHVRELLAEVECRWIAVGERMPEPCVDVLVSLSARRWSSIPRRVFSAYWRDGAYPGWDTSGSGIRLETDKSKVTHWMPLPSAAGLDPADAGEGGEK